MWEGVCKILRQWIDAGFLILMDDFGSGYSSLNILKDLKVIAKTKKKHLGMVVFIENTA